jgi:hypothetical protein
VLDGVVPGGVTPLVGLVLLENGALLEELFPPGAILSGAFLARSVKVSMVFEVSFVGLYRIVSEIP